MGPGSSTGTTASLEFDHMPNTHKAWRLHAHSDLRFDKIETPPPAPDGVLVHFKRTVEAAALMQGLDPTAVLP